VYADSPANGAALIDARSQQWESTIGGIEPDLGSPKIAPGDSRVGFITFEVPKRVKVKTFQLTLDSGFADETGEWTVDHVSGKPVQTTGVAQSQSGAKIGSAMTLHGFDDGEVMKVTVQRVKDPAFSSDSFITPQAGKRFVAVLIKLTNVGTKPYSDSPSNGASVIDTNDREYTGSIGEIEPDIGSPKIRPGDSRVGYLTFEVPKGAVLRTFQFTLDSGFADETGEWSLR